MALTKLTKNLIDGTFGTEWDSTIQTSNFTAVAGKGYFVNTTSGQVTVTLPAGVAGNEVIIQDYAGTFGTNKLIINSNGSEKIQGSTDAFRCVTNFATCTLVYQDTTKGWNADNIESNLAPLVVSYLVIAGGGSGGSQYGGGGGAGGYRSSYNNETSGGGGAAETPLTLVAATNYTLTVGAGGAGVTTLNYKGNNGSDSVFSTITSVGGGFGNANIGVGGASSGGDGGSGGGGHYAVGGTDGGTGTTNQGYNGGDATCCGNTPYTAGGGGGAGAVGTNGNNSASGSGGNGVASTITGSSVTRAGGGGGGYVSDTSKPAGSGGSGGGGAGGSATGSSCAGVAGTVNTGSGGGGTCGNNAAPSQSSGSGGSGIVILRYPSDYTISGLSGTTTTVGSDKVTTFTNVGTGNIQFN